MAPKHITETFTVNQRIRDAKGDWALPSAR
jgi:hypothetical protein